MCLHHDLDEGLLTAAQLAKYVLAVARLKVRGVPRAGGYRLGGARPLEEPVSA